MVDSKPLLEPETRLPVGAHEVAISAPRYTFFTDTVDIAAGQMLVFAPELVPIGTAPNAKPRRRRPHSIARRRVRRTGTGALATTSRRSRTGRPESRSPMTSRARRLPRCCWSRSPPMAAPSASRPTRRPTVRAFNNLAIAFAKNLKWQPAAKNGTPGRRLDPVRLLSFRTLNDHRCRIFIRPRSWLRARWFWAT